MKLIHLADVHLGARPDSKFSWSLRRQSAIRDSFLSAVQTARQEEADLLLISGDLFHRPPLLRELKEIDSVFCSLPHTKVVLIAGNHDFLQPDSPLSHYVWEGPVTLLKGPELETRYFPELSATVYGFSYHSREIPKALYDGLRPKDEPGFHILLAHGGDASHIPYEEKLLAHSGFDYVALGHVHIPKIGPGPLGNPGSLEPLDKTETGPHGYLEVTLEPGRREVHFVPAARFVYEELAFSVTPETTQFLLEEGLKEHLAQRQAQKSLPEPIFLLTLTGSRNPDLSFDREALLALEPIAEVLDKTVPDYDLSQLYAEHQNDMLGMLIQTLGKETDPISQKALSIGIQALLDTLSS